MKRRFLLGSIAVAVIFSFSSGINANAVTLDSLPENVLSENSEQIEFLQLSL